MTNDEIRGLVDRIVAPSAHDRELRQLYALGALANALVNIGDEIHQLNELLATVDPDPTTPMPETEL